MGFLEGDQFRLRLDASILLDRGDPRGIDPGTNEEQNYSGDGYQVPPELALITTLNVEPFLPVTIDQRNLPPEFFPIYD